jgi:hypothetical protein
VTSTRFSPDVVAWRRERLALAGCAPELASALAKSGCDLHALLDLVERGCPPELAARIVAPLHEELEP